MNDQRDSDDGCSFLQDFYQEMNWEEEFKLKTDSDFLQNSQSNQSIASLNQNRQQQFDPSTESVDMIRFIDKNERSHQVESRRQLKQRAQLDGLTAVCRQHVLGEEQALYLISEQLLRDRQFGSLRATCIALSDSLYLVGNSQGQLKMFDRDDQEPYAVFTEKGKEFHGNAITSIAVHPQRNDYIAVGYEGGQIVLLDATNPGQKDRLESMKTIKDAHKGSAIANLQFCDLVKAPKGKIQAIKTIKAFAGVGGSMNSSVAQSANSSVVPSDASSFGNNPYAAVSTTGGGLDLSLAKSTGPGDSVQSHSTKGKVTDDQEWQFLSVDSSGKVIVHTIVKKAFIFIASKQVIVEPDKGAPKFFALACRFRSALHPQVHATAMNSQLQLNDHVTLIAIGSSDRVVILALSREKGQALPIKEIEMPQYRAAEGDLKPLKGCLPSICWGYGHSPVMKDKCYATLAVAWGPLVQLFVLNDVMDEQQAFIEDGYYIIQSAQTSAETSRTSATSDLNRSETSKEAPQSDENVLKYTYDPSTRSEMANSRESQLGREVSSFETQDLFIEDISYLADSHLLVLTRSLELKIFYTQRFNYGRYNASEFRPGMEEAEENKQEKSKRLVSLIDEGLFISNLAQSEYGPAYKQTVTQHDGLIIALGVQGLSSFPHLRWDESLRHFKKMAKGNWMQELARAIDIYAGKVKGFKDVPEEQFMRQETMKAELKAHIRMIVTEQLDLWGHVSTQSEPTSDDAYAEAGTHLDESNQTYVEILQINQMLDPRTTARMAKYRTLIAIAIEFCVTIQDCYFLFYDLFLLFEEEQLADIFLDELKPFIIAGRFSDWELPNDILQNHIINYYKDPHQPELIEKIIINLCLKDCPKSVLLELIQFAAENFLSTALLYLHTAVFDAKDEASCTHVILALLGLYRQAKETNPGSLEELRQIDSLTPDSIERLRAEKSQIYLGYKILWVIRLFLNGKKFPEGNIPEARWRKYVHEIVDCISQQNIMLDLLYIDAEAYFQIISILFYKGKVFDFVREDKIQQNKVIKAQQSLIEAPVISNDLYEELMPQLSHNQILERFEKVCQSRKENDYLVPDDIRLQYLFFVANVASKSNIQKDSKFYLSCMKELLNQSQKFLKFNQHLMQRAMMRKGRKGQASIKIKDENKHIYVSELALMDLMDLCEPLDEQEVEDLLEKTKSTRFNQLRVKLLEKKEDYVQCLQLFVDGMKVNSYAASKRESVSRVFDWINNVLDVFVAKKVSKNQEPTAVEREWAQKEDAFRRQIMVEFSGLLSMDAQLTFLLIDEKFDRDHEKFVKSLSGSSEQQYSYLDTMLSTHHDRIQKCIEDYLTSAANRDTALTYMKLQNLHLRLLCEHYPDKVLDRVRRIKKNEVHFALDDCLGICQEFNQVEACAIFTNKMTNYFTAATQYMTLLTNKEHFDYNQLIQQVCRFGRADKQIPHLRPHLGKAEKAKNKEIMKQADVEEQQGLKQSSIVRFDYIIRKVMKIIGKESTENFNEETIDKIWFFTLDSILKIKSEQTKTLENLRDLLLSKVVVCDESDALMVEADKQVDSMDRQQQKEAILNEYNGYIASVSEFFKSRIAFTIENTLKYIELSDFLDHIVRHDENIQFTELRDMIFSIFTETSSECLVLQNANRSANQYTLSSFARANQELSSGILFRYRQCHVCKKFLDEIVNQLKKKNELAPFRRGRTIHHPGFNNSDDEDIDLPFIDPFEDQMTLYDCGHAFHIKCIERHINEGLRARQPPGQRAAKVEVTLDMLDQQQCPWCYPEEFKVDFDAAFKKSKGRGVGAPSRQQKNDDALADSTHSGSSSDRERSYRKHKQHAYSTEERNQLIHDRRHQRNASVIRQVRSFQEQKLSIFSGAVTNEGVNMFNFESFH